MPTLLAVAVAVVLDLDSPRVGIIRASLSPLLEQRSSMGL
jgi:hypothetical protein